MSDHVDSSAPTVQTESRLNREAFYSRSFRPPAAAWEPRYRQWIILADFVATIVVVVVVGAIMEMRHPHWGVTPLFGLPVLVTLELLTVGAVMLAFGLSRVWHPVVLGQGPEEFGRLGKGLFASIVALNAALLAAGSPAGARLWVFVVVPAIAALVFPQRYLARRWLHRRRRQGRCLLPVLATGTPESISDLIDRTTKASHVGWRVAAACTVDGGTDKKAEIDGVPVVGRFSDVAEHVKRGGYRIVAVTPDRYWTPERLRRLAWDLEGTGTEMVIAPRLMEVAGPRLHISGVLGMPLLRVSEPAFTGFSRLVKSAVDRVGSLLLLILLSPLMLLTALAIKIDSRGPVLFKQQRIGKDGVPFTVLKFRTMVPEAEWMRADLIEVNEGAGLLFKLRRDPRVTRVGRILRRYSIDELPQLFNVLGGSMSLVGPRPPLPEESAKYAPSVRRRLLVKPGMTGLWQVSGRSELSWEESVRLDLRYVEDWSLALDLMILWKTLRAVIGGEGAY